MLTAEQKIRLRLTGDPHGEPHFQHEGSNVVRWLRGGLDPEAVVTFEPPEDNEITALCAHCRQPLGKIDASFSGPAASQLQAIRAAYPQHQTQHTN